MAHQVNLVGRAAKDEARQAADGSFDDVIDNRTSKADNLGNAADRDAAVNVVT